MKCYFMLLCQRIQDSRGTGCSPLVAMYYIATSRLDFCFPVQNRLGLQRPGAGKEYLRGPSMEAHFVTDDAE
eukprot:jgi/Botrbrau1/8253/Bobra.0001s0011.1